MRWTVRAAGAVTAAFFVACFLALDPIGQAIAVGAIAASSGALIALAIQQRAEDDAAAPAPRCVWVLEPEAAATPRPARVLRVMRLAPLALPGPSSLLYESDREAADREAQYAAWTAGTAEADSEIAAWEWDDPGEW